MKAKNIFFLVFMSLFLSCCAYGTNQKTRDIGLRGEDGFSLQTQAEMALVDFHTYLNQKKYDRAVDLYGGSYEVLLGYNPALSEEEKSDLLRAGCEINGLICLEILSVELVEVKGQDAFVYNVEFANPDGSQFVLGPCCGATEEEMPPKSSFTVHVECEQDGTCLVMDLPPYVP